MLPLLPCASQVGEATSCGGDRIGFCDAWAASARDEGLKIVLSFAHNDTCRRCLTDLPGERRVDAAATARGGVRHG